MGLPLETLRSAEKEWDAPVEHLAKLCGNYRSDEGGNVTLELKDGSLVAKVEGDECPAKASDERTVFFRAQGQQQVLRFYFDDKKDTVHPWAVLTHSRMLRRKPDTIMP